MKHITLILILSIFSFAGNLDRELQRMNGWTIVGNAMITKSINSRGKENSMFEGCDGNTMIFFSNNLKAICTSFDLALEVMPTAIIFSKDANANGKNFIMYKMLVKDTIYDITPR